MSDQPSSINVLQIGVAYYPKHWSEERWASYNHLSGHEIRADFKLPPYGVAILIPLTAIASLKKHQ